jgi:hypothetical protein
MLTIACTHHRAHHHHHGPTGRGIARGVQVTG